MINTIFYFPSSEQEYEENIDNISPRTISFIPPSNGSGAGTIRKNGILYGNCNGNNETVKTLTGTIVDGVRILTQEVFNAANFKYIINRDFNLQGRSITIPSNCILLFEGGSIQNGTINGQNTLIIAPKQAIFNNITISGTWNIPEITSTWFGDAEQDNISRQLFNLTSDNVYNIVTFEKGTFNVSVSQSKEAVYSPKSNTKVNVIGDIQLALNGFKHYFIFDVNNVQNVKFNGNGHIIGDYSGDIEHPGHSGEFEHGFGIRITNGSKNIYVEGLEISNCSGDSVYVGGIGQYDAENKEITPCSNYITLSNLNLHDSARLGISITNGLNVLISECHIHDIQGTAPQAGIDIEPNRGQKTENIVISNCVIKGTAGTSIAIAGQHEIRKNIRITDCSLDSISTSQCEGVSVEGCFIESDKKRLVNLHSTAYGNKIENCYIHSTVTAIETVVENTCVIQDQSDNTIFNNCTIESEFLPVFSLYGYNKNRILLNCTFSTKGNKLFNTDVECRKISQCTFTSESAETINIRDITSIENCFFDNENGFTITIEDGTFEGCRFNGPTSITFTNNTGSFRNNKVIISSSNDIDSTLIAYIVNAEIVGNYMELANTENTTVKRILSFRGRSVVRNNVFKTAKSINYAVQAHTYSDNNLVIGSNTYIGEFDDIVYTDLGIELCYDYLGQRNVGKTSKRPVPNFIGFQYFDTDLGRPIYWNGTNWVDATGQVDQQAPVLSDEQNQ